MSNKVLRIGKQCEEEINKLNAEKYNGYLSFPKASDELALQFRKLKEETERLRQMQKKRGGLL